EPCEDLLGVHAGLDELDGDQALDRLLLLRHPDGAHAALTDWLNQLVAAREHETVLLGNGRRIDRRAARRRPGSPAGAAISREPGSAVGSAPVGHRRDKLPGGTHLVAPGGA